MSDLLDSTIRKKLMRDGLSNSMDRVRHFYIDAIIILIVSFAIRALLLDRSYFNSGETDQLIAKLIVFLVYALYYTLLEYFLGFTIGKFLNKTRVISTDENKPTLLQIVIRTLTRLVPFGILTILPYQAALHDLFSKTRVVRVKRKNVVHVNEV